MDNDCDNRVAVVDLRFENALSDTPRSSFSHAHIVYSELQPISHELSSPNVNRQSLQN